MNFMSKTVAAISLGLATNLAFAAPAFLITHNKTNVESNAFVGGIIPSPHPTKPHSDGKVSWTMVKLACFGHVKDGLCPAMIKMETNKKNPINMGMVYLNLNSGEITPKSFSANGYSFVANGPGEGTLTKN